MEYVLAKTGRISLKISTYPKDTRNCDLGFNIGKKGTPGCVKTFLGRKREEN